MFAILIVKAYCICGNPLLCQTPYV